jgi:hypothetical protein
MQALNRSSTILAKFVPNSDTFRKTETVLMGATFREENELLQSEIGGLNEIPTQED